ncbi:MAG: signal peptidase I [Actinobacteria bacterium]|uniref:Unannotated protein n=1 Tax=freshwater metagenome TaxID=449393 RepID=A0A6J6RIL4_9ZZZZ|nr:signal peptidase I [Actinomycetota bacterium]
MRTSGARGRTVRTAARLLSWCCLLALVALLAATVVVPRLTGATAYTVLTGSMTPTYPAGTLVVVRPRSVDDIGIGTVVTFQLASGDATVVTHRVVGLASRGGEPAFQTQGDANPAPDQTWVRPVQVRGAVWYAVPYAGYLTGLLSVRVRGLLVDAAAAVMVLYAISMFVGAGRQRRRAPAAGVTRHVA